MPRRRHRTLLFAALASIVALTGVVAAVNTIGGPLPGPLPLFPSDNWWNLDISAAPVDSGSASFINFIGATRGLHPDFGGDVSTGSTQVYGFPYAVVDGTVTPRAVQFQYAAESDGVNHTTNQSFPFYPIPDEAMTQPHWIEGGEPGNVDLRSSSDRHLLIVDRDRRYLYELYNVFFDGSQWHAGSGAFFDLNANGRRPDTWTSADAAGLAILPGLVRYDEAFGTSEIGHAFRVTVRATNGYVYPASHRAGSTSGALPMGARLRLKASRDLSGFTPEVRRIFRAMQRYGLIVADNGSDMYVSGTYDTRWNNGVLNSAFGALKASDFEVVTLGLQPPSSTRILGLTGNLSFGSVRIGTTAQATLTIGNAGNGPLAVSGISYPAGFSGSWSGTIAPGGSQSVTVTFAPAAATTYSGMATVTANQTSGANTIAVSGTGTVAPAKIIGLSGNLAFGKVRSESTAQTTLAIGNSGTAPLTVAGINYPAGFSGAWSGTIAAGASQNVTVTFAPAAAGAYGGTVTVTSDATGGVNAIAASGTGTPAPAVFLRHSTTGQNVGWQLNGLTVSMSAFLPAIADANWEVEGTGDFDGDGQADVVWRNKSTGERLGWLMNGLTVTSTASLPTVADTNWEIKGVADFDGDGKADILLRHKITGQDVGWLMNGLTIVNAAFLPTVADTNWEIKGVGDFNADGKADILLRHKVTGQNVGWLMNGLTIVNAAFLPTADANWEIKGVGDFDGDRKADVLLRHKVTGQIVDWLMNGLAVINAAFLPTMADTNWDVAALADFNGDGKTDVIFHDNVTGQNVGWLMNGLTVAVSAPLPTVADTNWQIVGPR